MWIFLNDSFLSVVEHKDKADVLLVRSRIAGDIERAVPEIEVFELENADYRYRAEVGRQRFKDAMCAAVDRIHYTNFKNSVKEPKRKTAYLRVWQEMAQAFGAYGLGKFFDIGPKQPLEPVDPAKFGLTDSPEVQAFLNDRYESRER